MENKLLLTAAASLLALSLSTTAFAIPTGYFQLDVNQSGTPYIVTGDGITEEISTFIGNATPTPPMRVNTIIRTVSLFDEFGVNIINTSGYGPASDLHGFTSDWSINWGFGAGSAGSLNIGDTVNVDFMYGPFPGTPYSVATLTISSLSQISAASVGSPATYNYITANFATVADNFWIFDGVAQTNASLGTAGHIARSVSFDSFNNSVDIQAIPEPSAIALFGMALVGMGLVARRRKQS